MGSFNLASKGHKDSQGIICIRVSHRVGVRWNTVALYCCPPSYRAADLSNLEVVQSRFVTIKFDIILSPDLSLFRAISGRLLGAGRGRITS